MMHRCTAITFYIPVTPSTRAITPYNASLNKLFFWCIPRPRWTVVMCLARLSMAIISYKYSVPTRFRGVSFFSSPITHYSRFYYTPFHSSLLLMSHAHLTSTSPNFKLIFDNALKAYRKRTKNDLLTHPLAERLQACNSPSSILTVLQEQVQELNQSQHNNTKWLDPTVNVLLAFSETLGEGVGSVCGFRT
jgi:hypothetical protein